MTKLRQHSEVFNEFNFGNIYNVFFGNIYNAIFYLQCYSVLSGMIYDILLIYTEDYTLCWVSIILALLSYGNSKFHVLPSHFTIWIDFFTLRIKNIKMQPSTYVTDINYVHNFHNICLVL